MTDQVVGRAAEVARTLFPTDYHDGSNCRSEIGREGELCRHCVEQGLVWASRVLEVQAALEKAFPK